MPWRSCRQHGIETGMFFMWGYEGEELADIEATYEHVRACRPDMFFTTVSYPIKGTPYYDEVAPKLVQLGDWRARTDRDVAHSRPPFAALLPVGRPTAAQPRAAVPMRQRGAAEALASGHTRRWTA